jgi:hypothetical protein
MHCSSGKADTLVTIRLTNTHTSFNDPTHSASGDDDNERVSLNVQGGVNSFTFKRSFRLKM